VRGEEERTAPVGVHERHVLEVERVEQVRDERDLAGQGQVGVGMHRATVRAQRQDGTQVAEPGRQEREDPVPNCVVHEHSVEQDDGRAGPGLVVVELTGRDGDGLHSTSMAEADPLERAL
jgi:hypothetical protein